MLDIDKITFFIENGIKYVDNKRDEEFYIFLRDLGGDFFSFSLFNYFCFVTISYVDLSRLEIYLREEENDVDLLNIKKLNLNIINLEYNSLEKKIFILNYKNNYGYSKALDYVFYRDDEGKEHMWISYNPYNIQQKIKNYTTSFIISRGIIKSMFDYFKDKNSLNVEYNYKL